VIEITLTPQPGSGRCVYRATCTVDGQDYQASKRSGASHELARRLVAAGIPDQPVRVRQVGLAGHLAWRSLHRMALFDIEEGNAPLHRVRWRPPPDHADLHGRKAENRAEDDPAGVSIPETV